MTRKSLALHATVTMLKSFFPPSAIRVTASSQIQGDLLAALVTPPPVIPVATHKKVYRDPILGSARIFLPLVNPLCLLPDENILDIKVSKVTIRYVKI